MEKLNTETICGTLERIIYSNPETNFFVGKLRRDNQAQLITIVGNINNMDCGQRVEITGHWYEDAKYGSQFKIEDVKYIEPQTTEGIEKYLGSGLIKGIGPAMAKKIVLRFKLDTLKILDQDPQKLTQIEGFGQKRVKMVMDAYHEHRDQRDALIFLKTYGLGNALSLKVFKHYGKEAINILKENPYRLCEDIFGIGFKTADRIAQNIGIDRNSIFRAKAGIIYLLKDMENAGHCYCPCQKLREMAVDFLQIELDIANKALNDLENEKRIITAGGYEEKVYLRDLYEAEVYVSRKLKKIHDYGVVDKSRQVKSIQSFIEELSARNNVVLDQAQKEAIVGAVTKKILIITGSPGTGKSTILNFVLMLLESWNKKVLLAAPTGRASKRLSEATGKEAKTIHRLLKYNPKRNCFLKNEKNRLDADTLIIDEASMIDIRLLSSLLKAVKESTSLILVGDADQLPSVGPGNILNDIIDSRQFPVIILKKIYRQQGQSLIIYNAHKVRDGIFPYIGKPKEDDFFFIEKNDPHKVVSLVLDLVGKKIPQSFGLDPLNDIQVLVPTNKGMVGVQNLNREIQEKLNKSSIKVRGLISEFRLGDKVIQLKNNYEKDIYNGDIGFIRHIESKQGEVTVSFEGRNILYNYYELDELNLSYAISIHKSQGSEFPCIIIPILTSHYMLLQRNLLYTAITRAKRIAVLVGSKKAIGIAVNRNIVGDRFTTLKEMLA
ncbi:MAG: SF1B family DNA helicase RecD2 [Actinomycetota bacterium]